MPVNVAQWAFKRTKRMLFPHLISSLAPIGSLELLLTSSTEMFHMGSLADGYVK